MYLEYRSIQGGIQEYTRKLEYRSILETWNTGVYYEPGIQEYTRNQEYRSILGTWNTGLY